MMLAVAIIAAIIFFFGSGINDEVVRQLGNRFLWFKKKDEDNNE